jgi:hypothetical protein
LPLLALGAVACGRLGFEGQTCDERTEFCPDAGDPDVDAQAVPDAAPAPDAVTIVPILTDVPPIPVSGAMPCTSGEGNTDRDIGVDSSGRIYVVFECGGALAVVISEDGGNSFSAPRDLGVSGVDSIAVEATEPGVAYIATGTSTSVDLFKTTDFGQSWASTNVGLTNGEATFGISMAIAGNSVYITRKESNLRVFSNHSGGDGAFTAVEVAMASVFGDIVADPDTGYVYAVTDTPDFHIRRSIDGGLTWEAEVNPPGFYHYSDWALANSTIFVAGTEENFARIPVSDITTSVTTANVFGPSVPQSHAIAVSDEGALFSTRVDSLTSDLILSHFPPGSDVPTDIILPQGTGGSLLAASSSVVVYLYTNLNSEVTVGVEAF